MDQKQTPTEVAATLPPNQTPVAPTSYSSGPILTLSELKAKKAHKRRRTLLLFTVVGLLAAGAVAAYMSLYFYPNKKSTAFIVGSKPIATDLVKEVNNMKDNNFAQAKKVTQSFDDAQSQLSKHQKDLTASKDKIASLKSDYELLKPTSKNKKLASKINELFEQADAITAKYSASLAIRGQIFDAYGSLPNELLVYSQMAVSGGPLTTFVAETDKIIKLTQASLTKMNGIIPGTDDKPLYDLRIVYLQDTRDTFMRLNTIYRKYQPQQITTELTQYNERNLKRNDDIKKVINDYAESSSLANDFEAFRQAGHSLLGN